MAGRTQVATPSGASEDGRGDKVAGVLDALNEVQDVELFSERSLSERLDGWPFAVRAVAQPSVCSCSPSLQDRCWLCQSWYLCAFLIAPDIHGVVACVDGTRMCHNTNAAHSLTHFHASIQLVDSVIVAWSMQRGHSIETTLLIAALAVALHVSTYSCVRARDDAYHVEPNAIEVL